jgi:hypothetical protein
MTVYTKFIYAFAWIKSNVVKILLVVLAMVATAFSLVMLVFKTKRINNSVAFGLLRKAYADNETTLLQKRRELINSQDKVNVEKIKKIDKLIEQESKKSLENSMIIKGMSNDEVAKSLTDLGF